MMFEEVDRLLEHLDLQARLEAAERKSAELAIENERLASENHELRTRENTRNFFQEQQSQRTAMLKESRQQTASGYDRFYETLEGSAAERRISEWMRNLDSAPGFFKQWIEQINLNYLNNLIDNPHTWTPEFKKLVEDSLRKVNPPRYRKKE